MMRYLLMDFSAALIVLLVRQLLWMPVRVKGRSMMSTLHDVEVLWVSRIGLRLHGVRRGDVVICHFPGRCWRNIKWLRTHFVKRVIGLPGETIRIEDGMVYINDQPLEEPYLDPNYTRFRRSMKERTIGENEFFVMGDNRSSSHDSRAIGPIGRSMLVAKVVCRLWPVKRWRRFGSTERN